METDESTKRRRIKTLVSKLSSVSDQTRTDSITQLRLLSKTDPDTRPIITDAGAIPYITELLYSPSPIPQDNATATLLNLSISSKHSLMSTSGLLDALSHALRHPSAPSVAQSAAATLFSLLTKDEYRSIVGSKRDIIYSLVDILKTSSSHPRTIKDCLKAMFGILLYQPNRCTVIELGAVPVLFSLVIKDGRVGVVEDATAVIAQIAGCEEAGEAFEKVKGVGVLVDLLDMSTGSSDRIKENAVSGLLNLVQYGREEMGESVREMEMFLVDGVVDVAENGSDKGKSKAIALLKILDGGRGRLQDSRIECLLRQASS